MKKKLIVVSAVVVSVLIVCAVHVRFQTLQLFKAIDKNDYSAAETAIKLGADLNQYRHMIFPAELIMQNPTPLVQACKNGNKDIIHLLLDHGADINLPDKITGETPLLAALHGTKENRFLLAKYLIDQGADIHKVQFNNSPVAECLAVLNDDSEQTQAEGFELLCYLLESGADYTVIPFNENALTYAVHRRNYNAVGYLLEKSYYDVNEYDEAGNTALIVAAKYNQLEIAKLLLQYGADCSLTDTSGLTAYDYAVENGNLELAEILRP